MGHPALPGNNSTYPMGWWGWFDQGEYLKEAKAIADHNFDPRNYFYPPLYPALGAMFVKLNPMHAFAIIDLICFLVFVYYFLSTARQFIGWNWAVAIFIFTFISEKVIIAIWVEPWTSTLVAAIFSFLIAQTQKAINENFKISLGQIALWSALGGLIFLTRPVDAAVVTPLYCYILWKILEKFNINDFGQSIFRPVQVILAFFTPGFIGVILFLGFNFLLYRSLGSPYFSVTASYGFHPSDFFEKAVSILFDSGTIYNVPEESVLFKLKWLALVVPAMIYGLLCGNTLSRVIIAITSVQVLIYFSYADFLPTGIWRYHNIHYFKWLLPYAGLIIALWIKSFPFTFRSSKKRIYWLLSLFLGVFLLSIQLKLVQIPSGELDSSILKDTKGQYLQIKSSASKNVDKIFIPQLSGEYQSIYFPNSVVVEVDGVDLKYVRDYRFLPSARGVDLIFIRPIKVSTIKIYPGDMKLNQVAEIPEWYTYYFTVASPAWF